jgi:hypothetical protein
MKVAPAQYHVLLCLDDQQVPLTPVEIMDLNGLGKSTVWSCLRRLENKNRVEQVEIYSPTGTTGYRRTQNENTERYNRTPDPVTTGRG